MHLHGPVQTPLMRCEGPTKKINYWHSVGHWCIIVNNMNTSSPLYNRCYAHNKAGHRCFIPQQLGVYCEDHWSDQANHKPFREDFGFTEDYAPEEYAAPAPVKEQDSEVVKEMKTIRALMVGFETHLDEEVVTYAKQIRGKLTNLIERVRQREGCAK